MESRSHALAAGLFAIFLSLGIALALWWFSDGRESTREVLLVSSGSVNGLNPQATVRYRGIIAGKVASIALDPANPHDLLVTARIRTDLPITKGTRARLASQGVTGLAFIALDDSGDNPEPLSGEAGGPPRLRLAPGIVDEVTEASLQTLKRVRELAERLAANESCEGATQNSKRNCQKAQLLEIGREDATGHRGNGLHRQVNPAHHDDERYPRGHEEQGHRIGRH